MLVVSFSSTSAITTTSTTSLLVNQWILLAGQLKVILIILNRFMIVQEEPTNITALLEFFQIKFVNTQRAEKVL